MGCRRERTTSRVVIRRFQIRFQTIRGSVNSIENECCGFRSVLLSKGLAEQ